MHDGLTLTSCAAAMAPPLLLRLSYRHWQPSTKPTHVCRGLLRISPSSLTMPTPILLADPSIPSTIIGCALAIWSGAQGGVEAQGEEIVTVTGT